VAEWFKAHAWKARHDRTTVRHPNNIRLLFQPLTELDAITGNRLLGWIRPEIGSNRD
jgi:hypothetical protein